MPPQNSSESGSERPADKVCAAPMLGGCPCGRQIHPSAHDNRPVCIMHSADPEKDNGQFQSEFEHILHDPKEGIADFSGFVFPHAAYVDRTFSVTCVFAHATFLSEADFRGARFLGEADFFQAHFVERANFAQARFCVSAYFSAATFDRDITFWNATVAGGAFFGGTVFSGEADLSGRFGGMTDFANATFS